jgi:predicted transcriptional regulator
VKEPRLSKAETRILEQYWKLGTASVREVLESLPEDERVAYTTVQTLVYRLEEKGALRKVKKIGNAQLFQPAINQGQYRSRLVRDLLDLFGGSPRLLVSNLLENGTITLRDLKDLQNAAARSKNGRSPGGKTCMSTSRAGCITSASSCYKPSLYRVCDVGSNVDPGRHRRNIGSGS